LEYEYICLDRVTSIVSDDADKGSSASDSGSDKDILDALNLLPQLLLSKNCLLPIIRESIDVIKL
jgi:hypothetical protein